MDEIARAPGDCGVPIEPFDGLDDSSEEDASHNSIMFARMTCYAFVRPKKKSLELVVFLPHEVTSPRAHGGGA